MLRTDEGALPVLESTVEVLEGATEEAEGDAEDDVVDTDCALLAESVFRELELPEAELELGCRAAAASTFEPSPATRGTFFLEPPKILER